MNENISYVILTLKPFVNIILASATFLIFVEFLVLRSNFLKVEESDEIIMITERDYDKRFLSLLESLRLASVGGAFEYKTSTTFRELINHLTSKYPDRTSLLGQILQSIEGHMYGYHDLEDSDFKLYKQWTSKTVQTRKSSSLRRVKLDRRYK